MLISLKRRALCVTNNEEAGALIKEALRARGYDIVEARNVVECWDKVRTEHFDIYLLGLRFRLGSGLALCRRIRGIGILAPIIITSSASSSYYKLSAERAGAQDFLSTLGADGESFETVTRLIREVRHQTDG